MNTTNRLITQALAIALAGVVLASCSDSETSSGSEASSAYAGQYDATKTIGIRVLGWGQKATATAFATGYTTPVNMDLSRIGSPDVYYEFHPTKPDYVRLGVRFKMSYRVIVEDDGTVTGSATGFTSNGKCTVRGSTTIVNKVAAWTGTTSCTSDLTGTCTVTGTQTIDFSSTDPVIKGSTEYSCPVGGFKASYSGVLSKTSGALSKTSTGTSTAKHLKSADGVTLSGMPVF